jgi:hypothetical protein
MGDNDDEEPLALTLWLRLKSGWGWLSLGIAALGGSSFIQHEIQPFLSVWQIFWVTLPLTTAVAILTVMELTGHLTLGRGVWVIVGTCAASIVTGVTAGQRVYAYLFQAQYDCFPRNESSPQICYATPGYPHASGNPVVSVLAAYLHLYGVAGFLSAILVGAFFGWAARNIAALPAASRARPAKAG